MIKATIAQDSTNSNGDRLITFSLTYGRLIHSEMLRHRAASHSVKSSRAIPLKTYRKEVEENPYVPVKFGTNQKGMQAGEETDASASHGKTVWKISAKIACLMHSMMEKANIHKEVANRILEPYVWVEETLTVEHDALIEMSKLRIHEDAQEDIRVVIEMMLEAVEQNTPLLLGDNEWHLPYVVRKKSENGQDKLIYLDNDGKILTLDEAIVCSAARCARSSYANHDNSMTTYENDSKLADRLIGSNPMHLSPFEHQARPFNDEKEKERFSSNFRHFFQQRKAIEFEVWKYETQSIHEEKRDDVS
jgi:thymidylate synthase ThyX